MQNWSRRGQAFYSLCTGGRPQADTLYSRGRCQRSAAVGTWRSLVAHLLWEQGVGGSNPLVPTTRSVGAQAERAGVAQLAEHRPSKPFVAGSNPVARFFLVRVLVAKPVYAPVAQLDRATDF
jgi:hypothetical protein